MRSVLSATPLDLVDLLFYLERLEVIELGFVGLKLGVEFVFARLLLQCRLAREGGSWVRKKCGGS